MHKIRIKQWMQDWLDERFGSQKGRIIEKLLIERYGDEMEEFYNRLEKTPQISHPHKK